jgi:hypothetical protein
VAFIDKWHPLTYRHGLDARGPKGSGHGRRGTAGQYDGDRFNVIVIHQWRDGLVDSETSYYAAPFEAPAWRARWVEPAPSAASN